MRANMLSTLTNSVLGSFCLSVSFSSRTLGLSVISFNPSIASNGMVNSATTSIEATVRNFEYIGT